MSGLIVRRATADDVPVLATLIGGFAKGHPAEGHARSEEMLKEALFGCQPIAHELLAEKNATAIVRMGSGWKSWACLSSAGPCIRASCCGYWKVLTRHYPRTLPEKRLNYVPNPMYPAETPE